MPLKKQNKNQIQPDPVSEYYRYISNAEEMLMKYARLDEDGFFEDEKYVKVAGDLAYKGLLIVLDALMQKKNIKTKGRKSIEKYQEFLANENRRMMKYLNEAYRCWHIMMGYDGDNSIEIWKLGLKFAEEIVNWAKPQLSTRYKK